MSDFEDAKLILTPNAYKAGKAYSVKPFDGSGDFTVVRNTTATRVNENGLIESVGANVPRLNYPIGGGCPSWLIEPQATNKIVNSNAFTNYLTIGTVVLTENYGISPDGLMNSTRVQIAGSSALYNFSLHSGNTEANTLYIKGVAGETIKFGRGDFANTGDVFTLTGEWQRLVYISQSGNQYSLNTFAGSTATDVEIYGAQAEESSYPTSYIPTNGTAVTRNADVLTVAPPSGTTEIVETLKDITYYIGGRNLVTYSEDFSDASWVKDGLNGLDSDVLLSPDGNIKADKIKITSASQGHGVTRNDSYISGLTYTLSVFVKISELSRIQLATTASNEYANFNLNTVSVVDGTYTDAKIEDYGNGWYRCSIVITATSSGSKALVIYTIDIDNRGRFIGWSGTLNDGLYIWGAQLEQGNLTDYQATRDIVTVPTTYQLPNGEIKKVIMT